MTITQLLEQASWHLDTFGSNVDLLLNILHQDANTTDDGRLYINVSMKWWNWFSNPHTRSLMSQPQFLDDGGNAIVMSFNMPEDTFFKMHPTFRQLHLDRVDFCNTLESIKSMQKTPQQESILNGHLSRWEIKCAFLKEKALHVRLDTPPNVD